MRLLAPQTEIARLGAKSARPFARVLARMAAAIATRDTHSLDLATIELADQIGHTMMQANVIGRRRLLLEIDASLGRKVDVGRTARGVALPVGAVLMAQAMRSREVAVFGSDDGYFSARLVAAASSATPLIPKVPFKEAIRDFISRDPRLSALHTGEDVAALYASEHVFAMAWSARLRTTRRVQDLLAAQLQKGLQPYETERRIARLLLEPGATVKEGDPSDLMPGSRS